MIHEIRQRVEAAIKTDAIDITDDSHLHQGHAGAQGGAGHFSLKVISDQFRTLSLIKRHQLIYAALSDLIPDSIHALRINALTPEEATNAGKN